MRGFSVPAKTGPQPPFISLVPPRVFRHIRVDKMLGFLLVSL